MSNMFAGLHICEIFNRSWPCNAQNKKDTFGAK